jgi:hypothetical protein
MSFWDDWFVSKKDLQNEINDMLIKSDSDMPAMPSDMVPDEYQDMGSAEEKIGRKAILEDPYFEHLSQSVVFRHKMSRLSNKTLKDVSVRDWLVSAIIQVRCDTLLRFSRISHDKFKTGFRVVKKDEKEEITPEEKEEIYNLEHFLYNCGRTEGTPEEDKMLLGEFFKLTARDALTFGHVSVEKIKTKSKGLHRFRPVPAESVYLINKQASLEMLKNEMEATKNLFSPGENDPSVEYKRYQAKLDYIKYVQVSYDNRTLADFGDEDMIWHLFNPQNFADSMGYCYSPLELAIINITNHLNVENYNANFFTHGYAARGILHLKGTVTQSQLHAFRRQYYNTISGAQHAWRTPIIAGLDEVEWVPLAGSAKEMEYIDFNNHLLRSICSQFQIDPVELGLDYLSTSAGSTQQASQEYKIAHSKERGLSTLLMFFEDLINRNVIPAIDMDFAEKYKFEFTGYEDETPQTQVAQLQAEMTVHSSMNDLLKSAQKCDIKDIVADLPLNSSFWALVEKNYTKGEIREIFFGDKDASKRRELQYIPGDPAFMGWQQLLLTMDRQKMQDKMMKEQQEAQAAAQQEEASRTDEQHDMEKEKHDIEVEQHRNAQAHAMAQSVQDTAKEEGVGQKPLMIGGVPVANPLNKSDKKSEKSDK